ncbi:MAG: hypothetical protein QM582_03895 [Micropruina sp.]|uniref:hypothetical protein n=1 Tax=Micropruina sp. TaxID=2737536 RepID=UPI0039E4F66E
MSDRPTIRVSRTTRDEPRRAAQDRHQAVAETVRRLRQDEMGRDLDRPLTDEEVAWLDADTE